MNTGRYVFAQVADFIPRYEFDRIVRKYNGDYHVRELSCYNLFLHLMFGQLTACNSIRDICLCLKAHQRILYPLGFRQTVNVSSLSRANRDRDCRIWEELGLVLIGLVRPLYANDPVPDVNYNIDRSTGLVSDRTIRLTGYKPSKLYPENFRMVEFTDPDSGDVLAFITNLTEVGPLDVANLYRNRWQIETFFKWIKQNLTVKSFWGHSENAVKTHLWTAICTYLIVARIKASIKDCPYTITEVATLLGVSALSKTNLTTLLTNPQNDLLNQNQDVNEPTLF